MALTERVRALVDARAFHNAIMVVIVVNAATLGLETSKGVYESQRTLLHAVDKVALGIFVAELAARLLVYRLRFFRDPWNCFDFLVVGLALFPDAGPISVLRGLRVLRTLRLISMVPSMRRVVGAVLSAIPGMASIIALLSLILYIGGVMATQLFRDVAPQYFGNLGRSLFTLFQVMTGEGWSEVARAVMDVQPMAWIFFVAYILVSTFVVLNLFMAVLVNAMDSQATGEIQEDLTRLEEREQHTDALVLAELRNLRAELAELRARHLSEGHGHGAGREVSGRRG